MFEPTSEKDREGRLHCPAAERNKAPILDVLKRVLPATGLALEIASGTGQHVVHFARALPNLIWQPSDPDPELRRSISARLRSGEPENVRQPLDLDVLCAPWPVSHASAVVCINMIHIAPWAATGALLSGGAQVLASAGVMFLYGPYRRGGAHTAPSNEAFDLDLRARNPEWGVRDLEEIALLAEAAGLELEEIVEMPANNLSVILSKGS
jgi:hypothetical protein